MAKTKTLAMAAVPYVPVAEDFVLKNASGELALDANFASQSFWKDVLVRFFRKKSAVIGMLLIIIITLLAVVRRIWPPGWRRWRSSAYLTAARPCAPPPGPRP